MALDDGTKVRVHYRGTLDDGEEFDNSYDRGEPLEFEVGSGQVINGFDDAVRGMGVGDKLKVTIPCENAYGERIDEAMHKAPLDQMPEGACVGAMLQGMTEDGRPVAGVITEMDDQTAMIDFNHPLAGKDLTFELELVEVVDA